MAEKLLDRSNVIAGLEQVCGEGMTECVAANMFDQACLARGFLYSALENRLMNMMAPLLPCAKFGIKFGDAKSHQIYTIVISAIKGKVGIGEGQSRTARS
jgi:hypothetical protein